MTVKFSRLLIMGLVVLVAAGIAMTILAVINGTLTGDWVDATSAVGYPAVGFDLLALAGLGVVVFLAAVTSLIAVLVARSRTG